MQPSWLLDVGPGDPAQRELSGQSFQRAHDGKQFLDLGRCDLGDDRTPSRQKVHEALRSQHLKRFA